MSIGGSLQTIAHGETVVAVVEIDLCSLGADAIAEQKALDLQQHVNAYRDLSTSMAVDER